MASSRVLRPETGASQNTVLLAAVKSAQSYVPPEPRYSSEEAEAGVRHAQVLFRDSILDDRNLVAELIQSRRAESIRE